MTHELKLSPKEYDILLVALGMAATLAMQYSETDLARSILRLTGIVEAMHEDSIALAKEKA